MMNRKKAIPTLIVSLLLVCGFLFLYTTSGTKSVPGGGNQPVASSSAEPGEPDSMTEDQDETASQETIPKAPLPHPKDVEEIKKQIYGLNIETVDDLPELDRVVQTGNAPTKDFWGGNWAGVDDFKEESNGFKLEPQNDGTFMFYPDEKTTRTYTFFETPKTYTYDPVKKEFSWEIDYYGKKISHIAKFINDNVLVTALVSGRKVTLDIYQKQPEQQTQQE